MKLKYLLILLIISVSNLPVHADENEVYVKKTDKCISVYARGTGSGYTLASAKVSAFSNIMPQLIDKTQDLPGSLQNNINTNGVEIGTGIDNIEAQLVFRGYWILENGIYTYSIELLLDNTNQPEDAEKP